MVGQLEEAVSDAKAQVVRLEDHILALNTKHASEIRSVRQQLDESSAAITEASDRVAELEEANHDLKCANPHLVLPQSPLGIVWRRISVFPGC
jgi:predicted  nucleic acid-binding Zn-ribbon protein